MKAILTTNKKNKITYPTPTIITLILPTPEGAGITPERASATLLIQPGDLAHVRPFHYSGYLPDVMPSARRLRHCKRSSPVLYEGLWYGTAQ
ncbi:MAG: hypothetical protein H6672_00975 [Anaerolineaceae bacterium]|nr:hypothetical protein [Anaerolineaceae bacterium]